MANNDKKHLKLLKYDSVAKFGIEGVVINTIFLFFSDKNYENIIYLSLKAVQWFPFAERLHRQDWLLSRRSANGEPLHCLQ